MICAKCNSEENHGGPFCRACGAELRPQALRETTYPTSPLTARAEITRAVAYKISQLNSVGELKKVTEDVLPQLEKFLETPQEKRLRRVRAGVVIAASGLGVALFFILMGVFTSKEMLPLMAIGLTAFLIGIGLVINGKWFTLTAGTEPEPLLAEQVQQFIAEPPSFSATARPSGLNPTPLFSITENTTHKLVTQPSGKPEPGFKAGA